MVHPLLHIELPSGNYALYYIVCIFVHPVTNNDTDTDLKLFYQQLYNKSYIMYTKHYLMICCAKLIRKRISMLTGKTLQMT